MGLRESSKMIDETKEKPKTLETEVKEFVDNLPYWAQILCEKIMTGHSVSDDDIDIAHSYLLEELELKETTEKPEIKIVSNLESSSNYKDQLSFVKLENVEGVNAISDGQQIEFSPSITIIYGINGSGKTQ